MTVGKCLDDFDANLANKDVHNTHFKVRFTKDYQEDIRRFLAILANHVPETQKHVLLF